jgi:hypothetical protein
LITDNILVAYECVHAIRGKMQGKNGYSNVKLDMLKAYDRVEWGYLKDMMQRLGFTQQWVELIMACVTTVNYRVWFNSDDDKVIHYRRICFFTMCRGSLKFVDT